MCFYSSQLKKITEKIQWCKFLPLLQNIIYLLHWPIRCCLIQSIAPTDSSEKTAFSQIHLNATKCTNIIRQGTGLYFASMLTKKLQKTKLSLILDETADVVTEKQLGIVVVYCDAENLNLITQFFNLFQYVPTQLMDYMVP